MNKDALENELKFNILKDMNDEEKVAVYHADYELIQEEHERMSSLAERVMNSLYGETEEISLMMSLLDKEEIKLYEKEFFPVFQEDAHTDILKILKRKFHRKYKTVFLNLPYEEIRKLNISYVNGEITDEKGKRHSVRFKFKKEEKYIRKLKEIYSVIRHNKIKWENIYCPFIYKAYSLIIDEIPEELEDSILTVDKLAVKVDYPSEIMDKVIEKTLCWNIREEMETPVILVRPTEEQIYYEHIFMKIKEDVLVCGEIKEFEFLYKDAGTLRVITRNRKYEKIRLFIINRVPEKIKEKIKIYGHMKRRSKKNSRKKENVLILRNKDEINETLKKYEIFGNFEITEISQSKKDILETYDLDMENKNEFLLKNKKKDLYLKVEYEETEYLTDILSFMKAVLEEYLVDCSCIFVK